MTGAVTVIIAMGADKKATASMKRGLLNEYNQAKRVI